MTDPNVHDLIQLWLDDYVDLALTDAQHQAVAQHVNGCQRCGQQVTQLQQLLATAQELPLDDATTLDLVEFDPDPWASQTTDPDRITKGWELLAQTIATTPQVGAGADATAPTPQRGLTPQADVALRPVQTDRPTSQAASADKAAQPPNTVWLWAPLALAALALVGLAWGWSAPEPSPPMISAADQPLTTPADDVWQSDLIQATDALEQQLHLQSDLLDPRSIAIIENNLDVINRAIAQCEEALATGEDSNLKQMLRQSLEQKLALLQLAQAYSKS